VTPVAAYASIVGTGRVKGECMARHACPRCSAPGQGAHARVVKMVFHVGSGDGERGDDLQVVLNMSTS
jgi:hypothetical protein